MTKAKLLARAQDVSRIEGISLDQALERVFTAAVRRAKAQGEKIGYANGKKDAETAQNVAALLHGWAVCYDQEEDARQLRDVAGLLEERSPQ